MIFSLLSGYVIIMAHLKDYLFTGVKPKCVQGRWLDTEVDSVYKAIVIREFFTNQKSVDICRANIPECIKERIIGRPICVACYDDIFVIQYITERSKFVRFFMIDSTKCSVQCFEDAEHYFHKDFASVCPVECLINPGLTKALFRLPQVIMSSRKWSKMLTANIAPSAERIGDGVHIDNVQSDGLRDRKNQAVAFHPLHTGRVAHVLLDEYCINCKILLYDLNTKKNIAQKELKLTFEMHHMDSEKDTHEPESSDEADSDSDSDYSCYEEPTYHFLVQCNIDYSKNGEILALCCAVQSHDATDSFVRIFLFSSHNLDLLQKQQYNLKDFNIKIVNDKRQLIAPIFSPCDSSVSPWLLERGMCPRPLNVDLRLPKLPDLQGICRGAILRVCRSENLSKLGLPIKLVNFLRFKVAAA